MPTEIYKTRHVQTIDGKEIEIVPLKIKYLREVMSAFELTSLLISEEDTINLLTECVRISMKQYDPELSISQEVIQDSFDMATLYKILNYSAGLKFNQQEDDEDEAEDDTDRESTTWDTLDLAKLESEVFLLGIWKNFDELESSLCLEELMQILSTTRELSYEEKKFSAAIQGIDLDAESGNDEVKGQQEWENMKARVYSGGATNDANDILALQGVNAQRAGFGIGMGLGYESLIDESKLIKKQ